LPQSDIFDELAKLMSLTVRAEEHLSQHSSIMPDGMVLAKKRKAPAGLEETETLQVATIYQCMPQPTVVHERQAPIERSI
jgi:hypothetical protein